MWQIHNIVNAGYYDIMESIKLYNTYGILHIPDEKDFTVKSICAVYPDVILHHYLQPIIYRAIYR